jgi:hypothetical protein
MLLLHPIDPQIVPGDAQTLVIALRTLGLIAAPFELHGRIHYRAGERFLELISFLGCMPFLVLDPAEGLAGQSHAFCHVAVPAPRPAPTLRTSGGTRAPPCPACAARPASWRAWLGKEVDDRRLTCPDCRQSFAPSALRWRRTAAYARTWIEVWGVYPSEAVPAKRLLTTLGTVMGTTWDYAYLLDSPGPPSSP